MYSWRTLILFSSNDRVIYLLSNAIWKYFTLKFLCFRSYNKSNIFSIGNLLKLSYFLLILKLGNNLNTELGGGGGLVLILESFSYEFSNFCILNKSTLYITMIKEQLPRKLHNAVTLELYEYKRHRRRHKPVNGNKATTHVVRCDPKSWLYNLWVTFSCLIFVPNEVGHYQ